MADVEKTPVGRGIGEHALAGEIAAAVASDEQNGGCDLSAGMFGPAMSALIRRIATEYLAPLQPAGELPEAVRERFQNWVMSPGCDVPYTFDRFDSGAYVDRTIEVMWKAYRAGASAAVDLEQFRNAVDALKSQAVERLGVFGAYPRRRKEWQEQSEEADRLLALIDSQEEARNG